MGELVQLVVPVAAALLVVACGDDDDKGGTSDAIDSGASSSSGGSDSASPPKTIPAPVIDDIMKMTGGLHVVWTNPKDVECDSVEGERKSDADAYKVVFTVPGGVDNKHDVEATEDTTYTYRLRCKVGGDYSPYSAERGMNPKR